MEIFGVYVKGGSIIFFMEVGAFLLVGGLAFWLALKTFFNDSEKTNEERLSEILLDAPSSGKSLAEILKDPRCQLKRPAVNELLENMTSLGLVYVEATPHTLRDRHYKVTQYHLTDAGRERAAEAKMQPEVTETQWLKAGEK